MFAADATYRRIGPPAARFAIRHPRLGGALRRRAFEPGVDALRRRIGTIPPEDDG
jgi:hypothetical protein